MAKKEIVVDSQGGGKNAVMRTRWTKTDFHCMHCGKQEVWQDDMDDYYEGYGLACTSCSREWNMPRDPYISVKGIWKERLAALVKAVS